jgi:hypothetical protein
MAQEKKYDVFISYSRKDSAIASEICKAFDQVGFTYFIDRKGIGGVANYLTKIADEIDNSKAMLLLASANSYRSKYVSIELHYAFNHDITILPYALDDTTPPKDFEILLIRTNWHYLNIDPIIPVLLTSVSELINKDITDKIETYYKYNRKFYKVSNRKCFRLNDIFLDCRDFGVKMIETENDLINAVCIAPELYVILEEVTI